MENASLPRTLHKTSLGTPTLEPFHQPCFFFDIPIEIRKNIYRYIVISRLDCRSHPRLWRPLGVDREVRGAQDRSATHNSANLPDYLDFGVYHT